MPRSFSTTRLLRRNLQSWTQVDLSCFANFHRLGHWIRPYSLKNASSEPARKNECLKGLTWLAKQQLPAVSWQVWYLRPHILVFDISERKSQHFWLHIKICILYVLWIYYAFETQGAVFMPISTVIQLIFWYLLWFKMLSLVYAQWQLNGLFKVTGSRHTFTGIKP